MKILIPTIIGTFISFTLATAFVVSPSAIGGQRSGQEGNRHRIAYTFVTTDIPLPDSPGIIAIPEDINDYGVIIANVFNTTPSYALTAEPVKGKSTIFKTKTFNCTGVADSAASSINLQGQITGNCVDTPSGPSKQFGFVRYRNGTHILLDFPGADHTLAFGINDRGHVVGEYYNPSIPELSGLFRRHGFLREGDRYTTIDFPRANTYTTLWSVNNRGKILGEYVTFDPATNETLEHKSFVYDNGNFILDFPESLEHVGGPAIFLADMNNDGQIIGERWNGGPEWNGVFLYDDGKFYDIELPPEFASADVRGMNNKGQFVGAYLKEVGIDQINGWPIYESHGYVATPAPQKHWLEFVSKAGR